MEQEIPNQTHRGYLFTFLAFFGWGLIPLYFKVIQHVPTLEIVAHRVFWMCCILLVTTLILRKGATLCSFFMNRKVLPLMMVTALLIASNWLVFTYAVLHDRVLDTSMGYFINPLFNVLLGMLFLKERLRPGQKISIVIASIGVLYMIIQHGSLPWIALFLPFTFGLYGLLRKRIPIDAFSGLTMEASLLLPFAMGYMVYLQSQGAFAFSQEPPSGQFAIAACGIVTLTPLMCFGAGVRRIPYTTVGIMQYIAPSMTFLLSIFVFNEPFDRTQLVTFVFIWVSL